MSFGVRQVGLGVERLDGHARERGERRVPLGGQRVGLAPLGLGPGNGIGRSHRRKSDFLGISVGPESYRAPQAPSTKSPASTRSARSSAVTASCSSSSRASIPNAASFRAAGRAAGGLAPRVGDLGERRAAVLGVRDAAHETVGLELVDDVRDARAVDLEALADLAERQRAGARERQQHERLVAREREAERAEQLVEARHQDLLGAHDRRHRGHRARGLLAPALGPVAARLGDRVDAQRRHAVASAVAPMRRARSSSAAACSAASWCSNATKGATAGAR